MTADLSSAAAENLATHVAWAAERTPGMRVDARDDLVLVDSGLACDTFNVVCRARLNPDDARERVRAAVGTFSSASRPFSWWVCPGDQPHDLGDILSAEGLRRAESEVAMVAVLAALPSHPTPEGLEIRRARSVEEVRVFAQITAANWSPPDRDVLRYYDLTALALLADDCPIWLYVGYLDGAPVAAAELTVGGGVVGLYNVSTLAAYRRRGFGTAVTLRPLLDARASGYSTAVLQAQGALGLGVYARLGFRQFGEITEYKPS